MRWMVGYGSFPSKSSMWPQVHIPKGYKCAPSMKKLPTIGGRGGGGSKAIVASPLGIQMSLVRACQNNNLQTPSRSSSGQPWPTLRYSNSFPLLAIVSSWSSSSKSPPIFRFMAWASHIMLSLLCAFLPPWHGSYNFHKQIHFPWLTIIQWSIIFPKLSPHS